MKQHMRVGLRNSLELKHLKKGFDGTLVLQTLLEPRYQSVGPDSSLPCNFCNRLQLCNMCGTLPA